jgi:hypothetical protein
MANYPAPPARRLAYDRDNTQAVKWVDATDGVTDLSAGDIQILNDEAQDSINLFGGFDQFDVAFYVAFLFPQPFKLLDAWINMYETLNGGSMTVTIEHSDDTTNGRDGTWVTTSSVSPQVSVASRPGYRSNISSVGAGVAHAGYRIKLQYGFGGSHILTNLGLINVHLYGPEHGPTDRLSFWHPVTNAELTPDFDFTDIARGATTVLQFRVKNVSPSKTAHSITVETGEGPSHGNSSTYTEVSTDNITYSSSINIGNLGPGSISSILYLRSEPPTNAELGPQTFRLTPTATGGYS